MLSATIWTGGHIVLFFAVLLPAFKEKDCQKILNFEKYFERVGIPALITLIVTGILIGFQYLGNFSEWFSLTSPISKTLTIKLILLCITLILAAHARISLVPKLTKDTFNQLAFHIFLVTLVSILFVITGVMNRFGGIL